MAQALNTTPSQLASRVEWTAYPTCRLSVQLDLFSFEICITATYASLSYRYPAGEEQRELVAIQEQATLPEIVEEVCRSLKKQLANGYAYGLTLAAKALRIHRFDTVWPHPEYRFLEGQYKGAEAREMEWANSALCMEWSTWVKQRPAPAYMNGYPLQPWLVTGAAGWGLRALHFLMLTPVRNTRAAVDLLMVRSRGLDYSKFSVHRQRLSDGLEVGVQKPVVALHDMEELFQDGPLLEAVAFAEREALRDWNTADAAKDMAAWECARQWLLCMD